MEFRPLWISAPTQRATSQRTVLPKSFPKLSSRVGRITGVRPGAPHTTMIPGPELPGHYLDTIDPYRDTHPKVRHTATTVPNSSTRGAQKDPKTRKAPRWHPACSNAEAPDQRNGHGAADSEHSEGHRRIADPANPDPAGDHPGSGHSPGEGTGPQPAPCHSPGAPRIRPDAIGSRPTPIAAENSAAGSAAVPASPTGCARVHPEDPQQTARRAR